MTQIDYRKMGPLTESLGRSWWLGDAANLLAEGLVTFLGANVLEAPPEHLIAWEAETSHALALVDSHLTHVWTVGDTWTGRVLSVSDVRGIEVAEVKRNQQFDRAEWFVEMWRILFAGGESIPIHVRHDCDNPTTALLNELRARLS